MKTIFETYNDEQINQMTKHCFDTIEKIGFWEENNFVYQEFSKLKEANKVYSIHEFLNELYYEFASRNGLHKTYHSYLMANLPS